MAPHVLDHFCFSAVPAVLCDQDSVRVLPMMLAATCRTPPVALLLSMLHQMWSSSGYRWQRGQTYDICDSSVSLDWHDDPPQEVRVSCLQNLRRNAFSALVFLFHLIVTFSHLRTCPCAEFAIFHEHFPHRLTSQHCLLCALVSHRCASQCCAAKSSSFSLYGVSCCHLPYVPQLRHSCCIFQNRSGPHFLDCESLPHFSRELIHTKRCPFLATRRLLLHQHLPANTVHLCFALLRSPSIVAIPAKVNRVCCAFRDNSHNFEEFEAL